MNPTPLLALLPLATFSLVMSITPGPNNFMLLASGARFGLRRSLPHALGVTAGFVGLLLVGYAGVASILLAWPAVTAGLSASCALYLFWIGAQLLREAGVGRAASGAGVAVAPADGAARDAVASRPQRWIEAALFQFVNPKAWGMAVSAVAMTADLPTSSGSMPQSAAIPGSMQSPGSWGTLGALVAICALVNLPCILVWTVFGASLRRALERAATRRRFNLSMAALVGATAIWMLLPLFTPAAG